MFVGMLAYSESVEQGYQISMTIIPKKLPKSVTGHAHYRVLEPLLQRNALRKKKLYYMYGVPQLATIFFRGVEFTVSEESLALQPLTGTTIGKDIFNDFKRYSQVLACHGQNYLEHAQMEYFLWSAYVKFKAFLDEIAEYDAVSEQNLLVGDTDAVWIAIGIETLNKELKVESELIGITTKSEMVDVGKAREVCENRTFL
ncbi:hypothetical protein EVAR_64482_1 [Eumeta japonica]|uniref:Uncharacterized protein n=1 Tax=Eumeta variegata TaxID=151549 RepID=A0A4C1ZTR3_EUMVA|nr:hypothetical protein EVAR_64482_1 [Eumeta japonica]